MKKIYVHKEKEGARERIRKTNKKEKGQADLPVLCKVDKPA